MELDIDELAPAAGHNAIDGGHLARIVHAYEALQSQKQDIADEQKELMAEAKFLGYDPKLVRKLIAERKRDRDEVQEEQTLLELYREALARAEIND